jgi:3-hydroxybutyryl-CoA dehydrogenase
MARANEDLDFMIETKLITKAEAKKTLSLIKTTTKLEEAVAGVDHVVETIPENLKFKQEMFAQLDKLCPPDVSIGTNSSAFTADQCITPVVQHPERFLVNHWWRPALYMPLVEVIAGKKTDHAVTMRVAALLRTCHKKVVVQEVQIPNIPMLERTTAGWANTFQFALLQMGRFLVDSAGATPEIVDACVRFGPGRRWPLMPPFVYYDDLGLDWMYNAAKARNEEPWAPVKEQVEKGNLGMKSGRGFYDWSGNKKKEFTRRFNLYLVNLLKEDIKNGDL